MQDKSLQLVSYEQAQKLKELGFDWEVSNYYDLTFGLFNYEGKPTHNFNDNTATISAPTIALALKWFRDVEHIEYSISQSQGYCVVGIHQNMYTIFSSKHLTYEEAESALLDKLIELEMSKEKEQ